MKVENKTKEYYSKSRERHYNHPVVKAFAKPKYEWIKNKLDIRSKKVLEVGGGNGYFSSHFMNDCELSVVDISENQLAFNPAKNKIVGDAYALDFSDNSFDIVFASNLLHHLENPTLAIKEMKRVAKDYVVISEPNVLNPIILLGSLIFKHERGAIYSTRKFLTKLISENDLRIIEHTYLGGLVMPNGTPTFLLPLSFPSSRSFLSFFQIFITKK